MNRWDATLARLRKENRGGLSIYLPAGFPDIATSESHMEAAIRGGADWLEFGIPWSDPAADGPVIEQATAAALQAGFKVKDGLAMAARLRERHPDVPFFAMTYANVAYQQGWDEFAASLANAGLDGLILPDVPVEESKPIREALAAHGLCWIPLIAPTTPADRMAKIMATATGFVYVVSTVGITGQGDPGPLLEGTVQRAKQADSDTPLAVGFGIRSHTDVSRVLATGADGAIVGSHVVQAIQDGATPSQVQTLVEDLARGTR